MVTFGTSARSITDFDHRCIASFIVCLSKSSGIGVDLAHAAPDSFVRGAAVQLCSLYNQQELSGNTNEKQNSGEGVATGTMATKGEYWTMRMWRPKKVLHTIIVQLQAGVSGNDCGQEADG